MHGLEAIAQIIEQGMLWKQFTEEIWVMKLGYHEDVTQHFQKLAKDQEASLEFIKKLKFETDYSDYHPILSYLQ